MTPLDPPQRHPVLRILGGLPLLCAVAAQALAADAGEQCIVGDHAIGCVNERAIIELTAVRKDAGTLRQVVQDKLGSGQCRVFDYGARVQVAATHGNERTQVRRHDEKTLYWIPASWARPISECEGTPSAAALHQKLGLPDTVIPPVDTDERLASRANERAAIDADERISSRADARAPAGPRGDDDPYDDDRYEAERYGDDRYDNARYSNGRYRRDRYDSDDDEAGARPARDSGRRPPPRSSRPLPSSRYAHRCEQPSAIAADPAACSAARR